ncbi:MAG: GMC family oxidoreductase [Acidobacteria bacterium]|nr:GMC family oxidoreductase [Acidobacteriota bacterium]
MAESYDIVIAGAGTAGCILAARLAEHGVHPQRGERLKIAMIEAGPYWKGENRPGYGHPDRRRVNSFINYEMGSRYNWPWPAAAKIVGGSVMHFGTFAVSQNCLFDDDYIAWQKETGVDWTKENLREAVQETQQMRNLKPAPQELLTRGNRLFIDAARSLGVRLERMALARRNCLYCGRCDTDHFCKYDSKGTSQPYIDLAERLGVEIIPDAQIEKVVFEKNGATVKASGIACVRGGKPQEIRGSRIIVSCGYAGTPVLLLRSGYGPRDKVRGPLIVENPNVGSNLEGDVNYPVHALFSEPIKPPGGVSTGASYVLEDGGPDGEARLIMQDHGMSVITYPHEAALHEFAPAFGRAHKEFMRDAITRIGFVYPFIQRTGLKGAINADGVIDFPAEDARILKRLNGAIDLAHELLKKMGAVRISARRPRSLLPWHMVGTCRAGIDPGNSVVNPHFETHDIENLFICDGSVIPRQGSTYSAMPVCVVAALAWRRIAARHFSRG